MQYDTPEDQWEAINELRENASKLVEQLEEYVLNRFHNDSFAFILENSQGGYVRLTSDESKNIFTHCSIIDFGDGIRATIYPDWDKLFELGYESDYIHVPVFEDEYNKYIVEKEKESNNTYSEWLSIKDTEAAEYSLYLKLKDKYGHISK